jgi:polyvinyl alcohol dehydrogenase (cytochrome)
VTRPVAAGLAALALGTVCVTSTLMGAASRAGGLQDTAASSTPGSPSWTVYHGDALGSGAASSTVTSVSVSSPAWTSRTLDGQIYGEPLVYGGNVFVATENDTVDALSAANGAVLWSSHVGTPVPSGDLPCGDISPTVGITGTPVIDPSRSEIFVVADELVHGTPAHMLVGIDIDSGHTELDEDVDPPGSEPAALLQRTGLTLDDGRVVFGFGGNYGDCASYRGRVVSVGESGGSPEIFTVDRAADESQGAVWMGGAAPVVDSHGDIWVSTGNGSVTSSSHPYDDSEAALELSSSLALLQYFAPRSWAAYNAQDLDLSTAPALLSDGQVVVAGKSGLAYLLNAGALGGIGGGTSTLASGCNDDIDGGPATVGTTVYLPCLAGVMAVRASASPPALTVLWRSPFGGGPPIVAGGLVWSIAQDGVLLGLDPKTGAVRQQAEVGSNANHFPTPSVGDGLLLAPAGAHVVAFPAHTATTHPSPTSTSTSRAHATTTSGGRHSATSTTSARATGSAPASSGNGASTALIFGLVVLGLAAMAVLVGLVVRRARRH